MFCPICKTEHIGTKLTCPLYNKTFSMQTTRSMLNFEAFSSPDIFVGRYQYPNIYSGILSPINLETNPTVLSFPEEWFKNKLSIDSVLKNRAKLVYTRFKVKQTERLKTTMQELTVAKKPCSAEFNLDKTPSFQATDSFNTGVIANTAPLKTIRLTENPSVPKKVEKAISDTDLKAADAIMSLYKTSLSQSYLINVLSAGLLGLGTKRKLVPSRWSTTAVDDITSSTLLKEVKTNPILDHFAVFTGEYVGNTYVILLFPSTWSFEVLELKLGTNHVWRDYESFFPRKKYANSVTGAYYANRVAVTEYLQKKKMQASALVLREIDDRYYAPLGVGILRELTRSLFKQPPKIFVTKQEAFNYVQTLLRVPLQTFTKMSQLIKEKQTQRPLSSFFG
ncbi:hypothetical protein CL622_05800 [archaeon]|nr:hypothetical protein [archaeon]